METVKQGALWAVGVYAVTAVASVLYYKYGYPKVMETIKKQLEF